MHLLLVVFNFQRAYTNTNPAKSEGGVVFYGFSIHLRLMRSDFFLDTCFPVFYTFYNVPAGGP